MIQMFADVVDTYLMYDPFVFNPALSNQYNIVILYALS